MNAPPNDDVEQPFPPRPQGRRPRPDVPPPSRRTLSDRFLAYLDTVFSPSIYRRRLCGLYALLGLCLSLAAIGAFCGLYQHWSGWLLVGGAAAFAARLIVALRRLGAQAGEHNRLRGVVRRGVPVTAYVVQANHALFSPGTGALPCLVLFSFQPEVGGDAGYMRYLARRTFSLKNTVPDDPDARYVADLVTDERAVPYRRRPLPISFTDGSTVYAADLWVKRAYLRSGYLTTSTLPCVAEPGPSGGLELVPTWLFEEAANGAGASAASSAPPQPGGRV
jgi:hypothetical protein